MTPASDATCSTDRLTAAALTAARWHSAQCRKGSAGEPYINHLLEVASLVSRATGGKDINLVIAALLHDAIEDQRISRTVIAEQFGDDVASLVEEVTDDKSLQKAMRKRLQVENAPKKSTRAKILKLADKISNVTAIGKDPPPDWPIERQREYVQWGREWSQACAAPPPSSKRCSNRTADEADRLIGGRRG